MPGHATIQEPSVKSLLLHLQTVQGATLGTGTGFVVESGGAPFLITNYHVLAGRNPVTRQPLDPNGALPEQVVILQNGQQLGSWFPTLEPLFDTVGRPNWLELPDAPAQKIDVVALPLTELGGVKLYPYDHTAERKLIIQPTEQLSIIGFPFGRAAGGVFAIWTQGTVASEPDIDFDELPVVLVDSRTRPGQSGSPVVAHRTAGTYQTTEGLMVGASALTEFFGVYSGRINAESDLGMVWKASVVGQLLRDGNRPT